MARARRRAQPPEVPATGLTAPRQGVCWAVTMNDKKRSKWPWAVGAAVVIALGAATLRPVPIVPASECEVVTDTVARIEEGTSFDVIFFLENHAQRFYVNRGLERGLDLESLRHDLTGKTVTLKYPDYWTPLDPTARPDTCPWCRSATRSCSTRPSSGAPGFGQDSARLADAPSPALDDLPRRGSLAASAPFSNAPSCPRNLSSRRPFSCCSPLPHRLSEAASWASTFAIRSRRTRIPSSSTRAWCTRAVGFISVGTGRASGRTSAEGSPVAPGSPSSTI